MSTVQSLWEGFALTCLPADAGEVQRTETRLAFYAGALAIFAEMTGPIASLEDDAACERMSALGDEFERHLAWLQVRRAATSREEP